MPERGDRSDDPEGSAPGSRRRRATDGARSYAKYSGLALQMIVPILIGVYGGRWLDAEFGGGRTYTIIGSLLGIGLALYLPLRELLKGD